MLSFKLKKQTSENVADTTFKIKLNCKWKQNVRMEKLFMVKKGLDFTFYIYLKIWQNFVMEICLLRSEGERGNINREFLLRNLKVICLDCL